MEAGPDIGGMKAMTGRDWLHPTVSRRDDVRRIGRIALNRSPLARKIVAFNLLAILVLVAGIIVLGPSRTSLLIQRELRLISEAQLVADVFEARLLGERPVDAISVADAAAILASLDLPGPSEVFVFDLEGQLLATTRGGNRTVPPAIAGSSAHRRETLVTGAIDRVLAFGGRVLGSGAGPDATETQRSANRLVARSLEGGTHVETDLVRDGRTVFAVATPILHEGRVLGSVALTSGAGEIDALVRVEREQILQMVVIALLVSVGLSLVLASTIANPLSDLAAAADTGRERRGRTMRTNRIRIPDLSARSDEIGQLSAALRGMVAALYDRIDANEQFAADVAHEIKNPLASLQSAVGSLRLVTRPEQRARLLDVIDHDVRRLDRLVSEIANASRLDSELVREEEKRFDLAVMIGRLADLLGTQARNRGIGFTVDLPPEEILIDGLEDRLAQVFVNLVSNAISFCGEGDAIRIWARAREDRVLVVVEDTGPGIPESALTKIFARFYSERPPAQFGNNSGLGLAISKQIVEAHGGVIWAENIMAEAPDAGSAVCGARFVVGLPL
jgi:two-component system, OmpR family, sensor histidine kinase ChvG